MGRFLKHVMTSLKSTRMQTRLSVSKPGDEYELETDQGAEKTRRFALTFKNGNINYDKHTLYDRSF